MKTTAGSVTDYYGNFIYADNQLITIFAGDVRVVPVNVGNSTYWKYEYSMKDHLGNVRVVFAAHSHGQPELLQQTSYYPFGMTLNQQSYYSQNATENKFLYNSKELQDDQLAGNTLDWYDYGARFYDATLGRWHVVDPLAEKYPSESSYAYVANNSINAIDPDGRYIIFIGGLRLWYAARDQEGSRNNEWGGKTGIYNNDVFNYWSTNENAYGRAANISQYYQDKYNDNNVGFTSGSSFWNSQASDRRADGIAKAKLFHQMVQGGDITLEAGETIKVISHSQGGAHASGYIEQLQSYKDADGNPLYNIEVAEYITPHQPTDINHPDGVLGIQYSHENDQVSSRNYLPNGGTKFGKINGINNENFHHGNIMGGKGQPRANIFTRGGHTVTDNDQFIKKGE
jgi:RHS repeat-associated protein